MSMIKQPGLPRRSSKKYKKKTLSPEIVKRIELLLEKDMEVIVHDFYCLLELVRPIIQYKDQEHLVSEVIKKLGLTQTQFYWRLKNVDAWNKKEVITLVRKLRV